MSPRSGTIHEEGVHCQRNPQPPGGLPEGLLADVLGGHAFGKAHLGRRRQGPEAGGGAEGAGLWATTTRNRPSAPGRNVAADRRGRAGRRAGEDAHVVEVVTARARMIQSAAFVRDTPAAAPGTPIRQAARTVGAVDRIVIEGLVVLAHVGVSDVERAAAQRCRVDVELRADLRAAGAADDLARSVDYGAVIETIRSVAATTSPRLLETLAERMAAALLDRFGGGGPGAVATGVRLRLVKLGPPLDVPVAGVGVEIERERGR